MLDTDNDNLAEWLAEQMSEWQEDERVAFDDEAGDRWQEFMRSPDIAAAHHAWERDAWEERMEARAE
jgi:hypothetical protein